MNPAGRILALDYGEKRIGLALSDPLRIFAKPWKVLPNNGLEQLLPQLRVILQEQRVTLIVLGMPYALEGGNTSKTDETQAFMEQLAASLDIPIVPWDERYSTSEAIEELIKLGLDWKQRRQVQDAMAAALILKNYLENQCQNNQT